MNSRKTITEMHILGLSLYCTLITSWNCNMRRHAVLQHGGFRSNGNQYSFMQASFYIVVRNGFSMNFISIHGSSAWCSRMRMTALDIQASAQSDGYVGGQHDVSENAQYALDVWKQCNHVMLWEIKCYILNITTMAKYIEVTGLGFSEFGYV